jgi:hypothetical protein
MTRLFMLPIRTLLAHYLVAAEAKRRFEGHFADPALLPSDYKTTVFKIVLVSETIVIDIIRY